MTVYSVGELSATPPPLKHGRWNLLKTRVNILGISTQGNLNSKIVKVENWYDRKRLEGHCDSTNVISSAVKILVRNPLVTK